MARFLVTVWPVPGHLHPNLSVANELRARGHEVAFFTGSKGRTLVESDGFACFPFRTIDERRVDEFLEIAGAPDHRWRDLPHIRALWRGWLVDSIPAQLADLDDVLAEWKPDAIICDPAMWGPFLVLHEKHRIPVAVFSYLAASLVPGPNSPIHGFALPRPRSWHGRAGMKLFRAAIHLGTSEIRRAANAIRRDQGLPPLQVPVMTYATQMPLYLQQSIREFDYNRTDVPPSVHYVGLCPWDRSRAAPPPKFLSQLGRDRPWVYVTDGTMHTDPVVTRAALRGLGDLPVQIIVSTGSRFGPADFAPAPPNAWFEEFIPHGDLLPLLDLVITTGGSQTVLKALRLGLPLIVVPMAWDQGENAWRLEATGAGLRIAPREVTPERIRDAATRVLGDPSFRANAKRVSESFARYRGPAEAADLLERLIPVSSSVG